MFLIEKVTCIHGIELKDEDRPEHSCEQCADVLSIVDGRDFLKAIGMKEDT